MGKARSGAYLKQGVGAQFSQVGNRHTQSRVTSANTAIDPVYPLLLVAQTLHILIPRKHLIAKRKLVAIESLPAVLLQDGKE